jgi:hypothetical protein
MFARPLFDTSFPHFVPRGLLLRAMRRRWVRVIHLTAAVVSGGGPSSSILRLSFNCSSQDLGIPPILLNSSRNGRGVLPTLSSIPRTFPSPVASCLSGAAVITFDKGREGFSSAASSIFPLPSLHPSVCPGLFGLVSAIPPSS